MKKAVAIGLTMRRSKFMKEWYKVVILKIDIFESKIDNERHFNTKAEAEDFANSQKSTDKLAVVVTM